MIKQTSFEKKGEGMAVERFPIEASHIWMFARAIGDSNLIYSDDAHAASTEVGSIIAPPTLRKPVLSLTPTTFATQGWSKVVREWSDHQAHY